MLSLYNLHWRFAILPSYLQNNFPFILKKLLDYSYKGKGHVFYTIFIHDQYLNGCRKVDLCHHKHKRNCKMRFFVSIIPCTNEFCPSLAWYEMLMVWKVYLLHWCLSNDPEWFLKIKNNPASTVIVWTFRILIHQKYSVCKSLYD